METKFFIIDLWMRQSRQPLPDVQRALEAYADPWAREYVGPALAGGVEAAQSLAFAHSNSKRGNMVVAFWRAKVPRAAFSRLLCEVWMHDHGELIAAAGDRRRLRAIFHYARFDPSGLPAILEIWRGASGLQNQRVGRGLSWTTDRDVACWFAMRHAEHFGNPVVLAARVRREMVAFFTDERGERDVVIFDVPQYSIDGGPDDWSVRSNVVTERWKPSRQAFSTSNLGVVRSTVDLAHPWKP